MITGERGAGSWRGGSGVPHAHAGAASISLAIHRPKAGVGVDQDGGIAAAVLEMRIGSGSARAMRVAEDGLERQRHRQDQHEIAYDGTARPMLARVDSRGSRRAVG